MTDHQVIAKRGTGGHQTGARSNPLVGNPMKALRPYMAALCLLSCIILGATTFSAWAEDNGEDESNAALSAFSDSAALSSEELNSERAKQKIEVDRIQINDQDLNGTVSDNTAIGNNTGHNTISGDAFTGAAGFISSVQNTGNNVLIQNATIINVSVDP